MAEEQTDDRRATLEAAFAEAEKESTPDSEPTPPAEETPADGPTPPKTDGTPPEPGVETEVEPAEPGKVAPEKPAESSGDTVPKETPEPAAEPQSAYAAPVGWRGAAKQHWKDLPPEVQAEVDKREREIGGALREAAESRQFQQQFNEMVRPFESIIAAQGSDPLTATRNLMRTGATLSMGTPAQKAQTVAGIIQQYGVDIDQLAAAIDGGAPAGPGNGNGSGGLDPAMQDYLHQQLAPFQQFMGEFQQNQRRQEETIRQDSATEIDTFSRNPENVYFEDVRETMADLLDGAAARGQSMTLEEAYKRACMIDPQIATKFQQTTLETLAEMQTAAERRAAAASSIAPRAQQVNRPEPKDRREAIAQAWEEAERGA